MVEIVNEAIASEPFALRGRFMQFTLCSHDDSNAH